MEPNYVSIYLHLVRLIPNRDIQNFLAQLKGLELRKENLNAANICLSGINLTKCKYKHRSFEKRNKHRKSIE